MGTIQKALNKQIAKAPELALQKLITEKLEKIGAPLPPEGVAAFAQHILAGNDGTFRWGDDDGEPDKNHTLTLDDEDFAELRRMVDKLTDGLPDLIETVSTKSARDLFRSLRAKWEIEGAVQAFEVDEFRQNLEERWGDGLDLLRMLLTVCREIGSEANKRYNRSKSKKHQFRRFVLIRLHSRACQVTDEIITLLENGFADGAMARWRTLHEIAVVAAIIENGDEELAERYILHDIIDRKRGMDEYMRSQVPMGYAPIPAAELKRLDKDYAAALQRFGDDFKDEYGWAGPLMKGRVTFKRLQEEAGRAGMTSYYKMASYNVHVGSRSMFHRLTDIGAGETLLAGRSNAGMLEPGQNAAFTLVQITASLAPTLNTIDRIIEHRAVVEIRDAIPPALAKADRKLRRDEAAYQKSRLEPKKKAGSTPQKPKGR